VKIIWAESVKLDLQDIEDYISKDNPLAAYNTVITIIEKTEILLSRNSAIGRAGRLAGTRELVIAKTPYVVPYTIKDNYIHILRVIHEARQWPQV